MWKLDPEKIKAWENYFRLNYDNIFDDWWNNPSNLMHFSKDFIREFKDKFKWKTEENKTILRMLGHEFYKEIMRESYKL